MHWAACKPSRNTSASQTTTAPAFTDTQTLNGKFSPDCMLVGAGGASDAAGTPGAGSRQQGSDGAAEAKPAVAAARAGGSTGAAGVGLDEVRWWGSRYRAGVYHTVCVLTCVFRAGLVRVSGGQLVLLAWDLLWEGSQCWQ